MKSAKEYIDQFKPNNEYPDYYASFAIEKMINKARKDLLLELATKLKTHKTGNSGSWMDASINRTPIIEMIQQLNQLIKTTNNKPE